MSDLGKKIGIIAVFSLFVCLPISGVLMANYTNTACFISGLIIFALPLMVVFGIQAFIGRGVIERLGGICGLIVPVALSMSIVGFMAMQGALPIELSWMAIPSLIFAVAGGLGKGASVVIVIFYY